MNWNEKFSKCTPEIIGKLVRRCSLSHAEYVIGRLLVHYDKAFILIIVHAGLIQFYMKP